MVLLIWSVLCVDVMLKSKIMNAYSCVAVCVLLKDFFKPSFTQLGTQERINILLYGYPPEQIEYLQRRYYQVCN